MFTLIEIVALIWSFFPVTLIFRRFVVNKGGRERNPNNGRFVSRSFSLTIGLLATFICAYFVNPFMISIIGDLCGGNTLLESLLLVIGLVIYYKILKP